MQTEIKVNYVAKSAKQMEEHWSRGVNVDGEWFNVVRKTQEEVDEQFGKDKIYNGNTVKVEVDDINKKQIHQFLELVEKAESRYEFRYFPQDDINLETLLNDAHKKGINSIETQIISHNPEKKQAIFKASVMIEGNTFHAHGDADETNTTETIFPHYIRMAETRAICRALRWATNNAQATSEEKESRTSTKPPQKEKAPQNANTGELKPKDELAKEIHGKSLIQDAFGNVLDENKP